MEKYDNTLIYLIGIICVILFVGTMFIAIEMNIDPILSIVSAFGLTACFIVLTPNKWFIKHGKVRK